MSEIEEKIAQILWRIDNPIDEGFSQVAPDDWENHRDQASVIIRAVLDAIAEPSEAVCTAILHEVVMGEIRSREPLGTAKSVYRAMIAALRKEIGDV